MAKGYQTKEIKQKLLGVLGEAKTGMSGIEISEKLGVSRITMTKYLSIFAAEGFIRQKNIGNVTLWFIEEGSEQFQFPDDYFKVKTKFVENIIEGKEPLVYNLIRNCLHSNASIPKIIGEIILPSVTSIQELYDDAKIGNSELNFLKNIISNSIKLTELKPQDIESGKNVILLSADDSSVLLSQGSAASYRSENWQVYDLGNMSESINVLFDLDLQKFLGKIWKQKTGVMIIVVFSQTEEGLNFFADAINSIRDKMGKKLFLILCGKVSKKTKIKADLISDEIDKVLQWSETVYESHKG